MGPSLRATGSIISSCSEIRIMGKQNTRVLPLPVNAMPIMSRPAMATGRPWAWMGVGFLMPLASSCWMTQGGIFMSRKFVMGGGTLCPSTMMRNISRIFWRSDSGMRRYLRGGFQPVAMLLVYTVPVANSFTALSAFFWSTCFMMSASSSSWACALDCSGAFCLARAAASNSDSLGLPPSVAPAGGISGGPTDLSLEASLEKSSLSLKGPPLSS
mmetsp:Transcript_12452/g.33980  ORF Transcript_12452/g.33980 Transcript_12452/m.33980 type:complete len:214 (+) Transcript_12452:3792-4433(+)